MGTSRNKATDRRRSTKMRPILSLAVVSVALTIASSLPQYANGLPAPAEESTNDLPVDESPESRYLITPNESFGKIAQVQLLPAKNTGKDPVYGNLELEQTPSGVLIHGKIFGLESGKHGFHVHAIGDLGNDCKASGSHFNPQMKNHGQPDMLENRHVGDLGNIETVSKRVTPVTIIDTLITLEEGLENDISGRAIVVHADEDDLGMGGNDGSLKTGNAGARLACGIIHPINY